MKLQEQVCSLELAQKLKTLGVKQKSLWVWEFADGVPSNLNSAVGSGSNVYAYSVAELGEILPVHTESYKVRDYPQWYCKSSAAKNYEESANTEAEVRGLMLEYLIKNKLIEV